MVIRDLMSHRVVSVDQNATLQEAAKLMRQENVGSLGVTGGSLVGIVTDRDLAVKAVCEGWNPREHRVSEIMSRQPVCVGPDADVLEASELMARYQVRRLPVCQNDRIVGVVSFSDIADYTRRCLDNLMTEETKAGTLTASHHQEPTSRVR
jgi:CBS domain-containing protein